MRWYWLVGLVVACNGGDSGTGDDDDDTTAGDDDDGGPVVIDCSLPQYDMASLSCDQLGSAFAATADAAAPCNVDSDCIVIHPACEDWNAVTCYYAVNTCFDGALLAEFNSNAGGCGDSSDVCDCAASPPPACVDHQCTFGATTQ